jgi:hypothetical protein
VFHGVLGTGEGGVEVGVDEHAPADHFVARLGSGIVVSFLLAAEVVLNGGAMRVGPIGLDCRVIWSAFGREILLGVLGDWRDKEGELTGVGGGFEVVARASSALAFWSVESFLLLNVVGQTVVGHCYIDNRLFIRRGGTVAHDISDSFGLLFELLLLKSLLRSEVLQVLKNLVQNLVTLVEVQFLIQDLLQFLHVLLWLAAVASLGVLTLEINVQITVFIHGSIGLLNASIGLRL